MKSVSTKCLAVSLLALPLTAAEPPKRVEAAVIDLAICLDTSGSMSGLIDSARQSIWAIVNDFALAKPAPELRIALLTYGNSGHHAENGWVRLDSGFTRDLDLISQKLFALRTNGGKEYVGRVLQASLDRLRWTPRSDALKLIVVAGNEAASQDKMVTYQSQCRAAIQRGIMVNAIYCGSSGHADVAGWRDVARRADGKFSSINQSGTVALVSPFDQRISDLSTGLNRTYIPLGADGQRKWTGQLVQDRNASRLNFKAAAQRGFTKSTSNYHCAWDLVDMLKDPKFKLEGVKVKDLPANMQKMNWSERRAYLQGKRDERTKMQREIRALSSKRATWRSAEMKRRKLSDGQSFESSVRNAVRAQARAKGLRFQDEAKTPAKPTGKGAGAKKSKSRWI